MAIFAMKGHAGPLFHGSYSTKPLEIRGACLIYCYPGVYESTRRNQPSAHSLLTSMIWPRNSIRSKSNTRTTSGHNKRPSTKVSTINPERHDTGLVSK